MNAVVNAVGPAVWLLMTGAVARVMYGRWRPGVISRCGYFSVQVRCVWAAVTSLLVSFLCWWGVGLVMLVMYSPRKTDQERQQELEAVIRERDLLDQDLAKSRAERESL